MNNDIIGEGTMGSEESVVIALIKNTEGYQATTRDYAEYEGVVRAYAEYEGVGTDTRMAIIRCLAWV